MFGYIRAYKPELRVKEFEMYKAIYCTLCKRLGKNYGVLARLTLSYDFTFIALLDLSLKEGCIETKRKCCAFNPLKKCNYCKETGSEFDFSSAAAMIMLYYKIEDNITDEKGIKRLGYLAIKPFFSSAYKKAKVKFPYIDEIMAEYIKEQSAFEKEKIYDADRAADPTAKALAGLFELLSDDATQKRILNRLGYSLGRYIYLIDAVADLEKDKKSGNYNPYFSVPDEEIKQRAMAQLNLTAAQAQSAFELLDIYKFRDILGNIVYLGLEETAKSILQNDKKE